MKYPTLALLQLSDSKDESCCLCVPCGCYNNVYKLLHNIYDMRFTSLNFCDSIFVQCKWGCNYFALVCYLNVSFHPLTMFHYCNMHRHCLRVGYNLIRSSSTAGKII